MTSAQLISQARAFLSDYGALKVTGIALVSLLAGAPALLAQSQWRYEADRHGHRQAFVEQKSVVLGSTCSTRLRFSATRDRVGKGITGVLALEFAVSPMSSIKGFDFEYFHGVGAPVGSQELMRITITKGGKPFVHTLGAGGYLSSYVRDGFVFHAEHLARDKQGQVRKVLDQVLQGAESLEVAITDGRNRAIVLSATFPLTGSKPVVEALLKGI
ncbi:MAG TPA: hypothetical protein VLF42_08325 [Burkholderiales bacterium]|nr:hypothetical protein [Burkholderiales bacterium]